jgi:prepilin-type processing-associated H-X9-DG protein
MTGLNAQPRQRNSLAVASLVCGVLGFIPFVSILAIVFGIVGLIKSRSPRIGGRRLAFAGTVLGCIGMLTVQWFYYGLWWNFSQTADRVRCASNVRQIGQAILNYSNDNMGRYPPDLGTLVKTQNLPVGDFLCPSMPGGGSAPSNFAQLTRDQQAQWVNEHSDFIYLGAGMRQGEPPETIVIYEKRVELNSAPDGALGPDEVQMLFGDGHVEAITPAEAKRRIDSQKSKKPATAASP